MTNNAFHGCLYGRVDPTFYLDETLKDDKDQNHNRSNNAEIKTAAVKDSIEKQQGKKT